MTLHSGVFNLNFKTILGVLFFSLIVRRIGLLFYGSSSAKDWWISRFPWMQNIKSKIIHNGIEQKRFKKKKLKKTINISFVGRVEIENNPNFFTNTLKAGGRPFRSNADRSNTLMETFKRFLGNLDLKRASTEWCVMDINFCLVSSAHAQSSLTSCVT